MILALLLLAAPAVDVEASTGLAIGDFNSSGGSWGIPLMLRAGVAPIDYLTISAVVLGIPGSEPDLKTCGTTCPGNAAFKAVSGFAMLRGHTGGTLQVLVDAGIGIGHLIRLSSDDLFENPAYEGRAGPAYWLGAGLRGVSASGLTIGVEIAWTRWTNVTRPGYAYGIGVIPPNADLAIDAGLILLNIGWLFPL
jgi:hypothetical protein